MILITAMKAASGTSNDPFSFRGARVAVSKLRGRMQSQLTMQSCSVPVQCIRSAISGFLAGNGSDDGQNGRGPDGGENGSQDRGSAASDQAPPDWFSL